jgi:hypothetical protein
MARPFKSGREKAKVRSISVSPEIDKYLLDNNISLSKLFEELFFKFINAPKDKVVVVENDAKELLRKEIMDVLDALKVLYINKLKPEGDYKQKEKQFELAVNHYLKKYPMLTKAKVYSYVERDSGYFNLDSVEIKDDKNKIDDLGSQEPEKVENGSTSVYMDASKNKIKEINRGNQ